MATAMLLLSLSLTSAGPPAAEGPKFSGRLLHEWLADLKQDDVLVREEAIEVLGSAGPAAKEAVPALEKLLKEEPLSVRTRAGVALWRITGRTELAAAGITEALRVDTGPQRRTQLLLTLQALGAGAAPAAAAVIELVDDDDQVLRSQAQNFFAQVGKSAFPLVLERLGDKDVRRRRQAALVVQHAGYLLQGIVPTIEKHLTDEDRGVRLGCARGLWFAGSTSRSAMDALAEVVRNGSMTERREVLDMVNTVGYDRSRLEAARPVLDAGMKSSDLNLRLRAAQALAGLDTKAEDLLPIFLEGLKSPNRAHWGPAAMGISRLGPRGAPAVPAMIELLESSHAGFMYELGEAFVQIGPASVGPLVDLLEGSRESPQRAFAVGGYLNRLGNAAASRMMPLLEDKDPRMRNIACQVLGNAPAAAAKSAAKLVERLKDDDPAVRQGALTALNLLGPAVKDAVPAILEMNKTAAGQLRVQCLTALERIGGNREAILPAALEGLKDPMPMVRSAALSLLCMIDPRHPEIVPQAEKLLKGPATRYLALDIVRRLGPAAARLAPALIEVLRTERTQMVRHQIVPVLGHMGPAAKEAGPMLIEFLKERDAHLQQVSLTALRAIGGTDPKLLVPALLALLREEPSAYYRNLAIDLLGDQGTAAAEAVPRLLEELNRQELQFQPRAAAALARIDPERGRKEGVPLLEKRLSGPSPVLIAQTILHLDKTHVEAMAALRRALKEADEARWYVRMHATNALGSLGPAAKDALPDLRLLLKDTNTNVRFAAALAVWRVGKDSEAAVNVFVESLGPSQPPAVLMQAAASLTQMGTEAKAAIPALLKICKHANIGVANQAKATLEAIDPEAARKAGLE